VAVLVVCTANVCRSPLAARLLGEALEVPVFSAGSHARFADPACPVANPGIVHRSVPLEKAHVRAASLVLGVSREHRSAAVALLPSAQTRSFTLLQAARLAAWLAVEGVVAPASLGPADRLTWWVEELDAARGDAPRGEAWDDDLADPHESSAHHEDVLPRLAAAVRTLAGVLGTPSGAVLGFPQGQQLGVG
jgi:protein-tyrosine phosphatase